MTGDGATALEHNSKRLLGIEDKFHRLANPEVVKGRHGDVHRHGLPVTCRIILDLKVRVPFKQLDDLGTQVLVIVDLVCEQRLHPGICVSNSDNRDPG